MERTLHSAVAPTLRIAAAALAAVVAAAAAGCAEVVAIGHVSDRQTGGTVSDVEVRSSADGANWRTLGRTDPGGSYWILKARIPPDSRIRLAKRGYRELDMSDQEFLASRSHLIAPTGGPTVDPFDERFTSREHEASGGEDDAAPR